MSTATETEIRSQSLFPVMSTLPRVTGSERTACSEAPERERVRFDEVWIRGTH